MIGSLSTLGIVLFAIGGYVVIRIWGAGKSLRGKVAKVAGFALILAGIAAFVAGIVR